MKFALISDYMTTQGRNAVSYIIANTGLPPEDISIGYIASSPDPDLAYFKVTKAFYASLGIQEVTYLDLEDGYSNDGLVSSLSKTMIHLSGGNTYRFLYWIKQRNVDKHLVQVAANGTPIIGVSAGALLLTPSIVTAAVCGDVNDIQIRDFSALNIAPILLYPHAKQDSTERNNALSICREYNVPAFLCKDSDAIVILNREVFEFGSPEWICKEELSI